MYKIAIVEDQNDCAVAMEHFLNRYGAEHGEAFEISHFPDGAQLVYGYRPVWDIILLDIEMPNMDGMTAAHRIREMDSEVTLLFVTNMGQYAIRGYEVNAVDFLLKPVSYFTFSIKMDKALRLVKNKQSKSILLRREDGLCRVPVREILYVEVAFHRLQIHTLSGTFSAAGSLAEIEKQLEGETFARCNKGYLVNLRHVKRVKADSVVVGEDTLLISRRKKKEFYQIITDYYGGGGQ